VARVIT